MNIANHFIIAYSFENGFASLSIRNIFFVAWLISSPIRGFNLSLISLMLGAISIGLTIGWQENFLIHHVTASCLDGMCFDVENFRSTIRLVLNLGACLGALVPPCLVDIFGRRSNFAIIALLDIVTWLISTLVINIPIMLIGAGIGGLAAGSFIVTATLYIGEVLPAQSRSTSTALVAFFVYIGILFSRTLSLFVYNRIAPFTMSMVTLGFFMSIYHWMIESPYYLYERGETLNAKLALKKLRGAQNILDIDIEYKSMELFFTSRGESIYAYVNLLSSAFMINNKQLWTNVILLLLIISQTIGDYVMEDYTEKFLRELSPRYERSILTLLDVLSIRLCIYLIQKIGRRWLLIISIGSSSVSCLILAMYNVIHVTECLILSGGIDRILTCIIVILYCFAYALGLTPILPFLTGEIFPNRIKTLAIGLCISLIYLGAMINQIVFELLDVHKGIYVASIVFSIIGSFGLFSLFILSPMRNTAPHEIRNELNDLTVFVS